MAALIECIPNVSEGRRQDVVSALANAAVEAGEGVVLLDRTSDADHNRSVLTFLGDGDALVASMTALVGAALGAIDLRTHRGAHPRVGAVDVIPFVPLLVLMSIAPSDLRTHRGAHPRVGAVDVIPFVPLRGATAADCVAFAKTLGKALADRYGRSEEDK